METTRAISFKRRAIVELALGIVISIGSGSLARPDKGYFLVAVFFWFVGFAIYLCGCINLARLKGYSGWLGFLGYLVAPGLITLACLPNRRARLTRLEGESLSTAQNAIATADAKRGGIYLCTLFPFGLLFVAFGLFVLAARSNIDGTEWQSVTSRDGDFQVQMPGRPQIDVHSQSTDAGAIEVQKYVVSPVGHKELYMIVAVRFPTALREQMGAADKLVELGRDDLVSASAGTLTSETGIQLQGRPGVEIELLPRAGAIVKARVIASADTVYQVTAHVPKSRLDSSDVQIFLDSFQLIDRENPMRD